MLTGIEPAFSNVTGWLPFRFAHNTEDVPGRIRTYMSLVNSQLLSNRATGTVAQASFRVNLTLVIGLPPRAH